MESVEKFGITYPKISPPNSRWAGRQMSKISYNWTWGPRRCVKYSTVMKVVGGNHALSKNIPPTYVIPRFGHILYRGIKAEIVENFSNETFFNDYGKPQYTNCFMFKHENDATPNMTTCQNCVCPPKTTPKNFIKPHCMIF